MNQKIETAEEKKVKEIISKADLKIKACEELIKHYVVPAERVMRPTWARDLPDSAGKKQRDIARFEIGISVIKKEALKECAEALEKSPVNAKVKAFQIANEWAHPELKNKEAEAKLDKELNKSNVRTPSYIERVQGDHAKRQEMMEYKQDRLMNMLAKEKENLNSNKSFTGLDKGDDAAPKKFDMKAAYPDSKEKQSSDQLSYSLNNEEKSKSEKFDMTAAYPEAKKESDYTNEIAVKFKENFKDHGHER